MKQQNANQIDWHFAHTMSIYFRIDDLFHLKQPRDKPLPWLDS